MSPKFYGFLWILFFVSAGIMWLGSVLTLTAIIAFGFTAFGLVFAGMMCVLPGVVSHPPVKSARMKLPKNTQPIFKPVSVRTSKSLHAKLRFQ